MSSRFLTASLVLGSLMLIVQMKGNLNTSHAIIGDSKASSIVGGAPNFRCITQKSVGCDKGGLLPPFNNGFECTSPGGACYRCESNAWGGSCIAKSSYNCTGTTINCGLVQEGVCTQQRLGMFICAFADPPWYPGASCNSAYTSCN